MFPRLFKLAIGLLALGAAAGIWQAMKAPQAAPQSSFLLLDGSVTDSKALQGRVVLVNFWATSCRTCVAEMPALSATYEKYRERGFETLAVAMAYDPPAYVVHFTQSRQLPFPVAIDHSGELAKAWGDVALTPTTFLLDRRGRIARRYVGAPDFGVLHGHIEQLLGQPV